MSEEDGEISNTGEEQDITCAQNNGEPGTPDSDPPSCPKDPEPSKKNGHSMDEDTLETPRPGPSVIKGAKRGRHKVRSLGTKKAESPGITHTQVASAIQSFMRLPPEERHRLFKILSKEDWGFLGMLPPKSGSTTPRPFSSKKKRKEAP